MANPALNLNRIFPPGRSWANIAEEEIAARPSRDEEPKGAAKAAYVPPHKRGEPEEGETKGEGKAMMIYTRKPTLMANGRTVRGHWVKAVDPYGDYGGPYSDLRDLLNNQLFRSDMADLAKDQAAYSEYRAGLAGTRARSRSRSRSRTRRHRSRSPSRSHSRRRHRSRSPSRSHSRRRHRSRSRSYRH